MALTSSLIQQATKNWLENIVIGFNFCPFARKVWLQEQIAYPICFSEDLEEVLHSLTQLCQELEEQEAITTALLILPQGWEDFEDYLDLLSIAEQLLEELGYTGIFQLASFHPQYVFGGTTPQDPSNYTNRAPYPILHLLREESIAQALEHYENPEAIPERNIAFANSKSLETWKALLQACYPNPK